MRVFGTAESLKEMIDEYGPVRIIDLPNGSGRKKGANCYKCLSCTAVFPKKEAWLSDDGVFCGRCGRKRFLEAAVKIVRVNKRETKKKNEINFRGRCLIRREEK